MLLSLAIALIVGGVVFILEWHASNTKPRSDGIVRYSLVYRISVFIVVGFSPFPCWMVLQSQRGWIEYGLVVSTLIFAFCLMLHVVTFRMICQDGVLQGSSCLLRFTIPVQEIESIELDSDSHVYAIVCGNGKKKRFSGHLVGIKDLLLSLKKPSLD